MERVLLGDLVQPEALDGKRLVLDTCGVSPVEELAILIVSMDDEVPIDSPGSEKRTRFLTPCLEGVAGPRQVETEILLLP